MAPSLDSFLAISCTNVGVGPGGTTHLLAYASLPFLEEKNVHVYFLRRIAIVDYRGNTVFDKYVVPTTTVSINEFVASIPLCLTTS